MYKSSYYNFFKELDDGCGMIYNTKTGAAASIKKEHLKDVGKMLENPDENISNEFFMALYQNGFIVKSDFDEYNDVKKRYEKAFYAGDHINIVLLPAETCNFTCPYCFIYNYKNNIMDDKIYDRVVKYIENQIAGSGKKKFLSVTWFGGEPLLQKDKIIEFMTVLHEHFNDRVNIFSNIITNGYLLTYEVFSELLLRGVVQFQVTFDGAREDHDQLRKLKNGEGSYDRIIQNLKDIVRNIKPDDQFVFALRINFLKNTYQKIYQLIDNIFEIIGEDKRFKIYCRPVYNFETKRNDIDGIQDNIFSIADGLKVQNDFTQYIAQKNGFVEESRMHNDYLPLPTSTWCSEDNQYSAIVGADGSIYACDSLVGDESVCVGYLDESGEIQYNDNSVKWKRSIFEFENFEDCKRCKCLPICVGSCKRERIEGCAKPCLWREEDIYEAMQNYYFNHQSV